MDESQGLREEDEWSSSPLLSAPFLPWPIGAAQPILAQGGKSPSGLFFCFIWNPQTPGMGTSSTIKGERGIHFGGTSDGQLDSHLSG